MGGEDASDRLRIRGGELYSPTIQTRAGAVEARVPMLHIQSGVIADRRLPSSGERALVDDPSSVLGR